MYGIKASGSPGTLAPMYQELRLGRREPPATSGHAPPSPPRLGSHLDAAEAVVAQIANAIGLIGAQLAGAAHAQGDPI
jgi:hypothetical protein